MDPQEKESIERQITTARNGVGQSIDELDRQLRKTFDIEAIAAAHAPELVTGGALVGFLVGFGAPKVLTRLVGVAVPVAVAWKLRQARRGKAAPR
jgi:hypothetical protein